MQVQPLTQARSFRTIDSTLQQTLANPEFLQDVVSNSSRRGFLAIAFFLSSLTDSDWQRYNQTGRLPTTYNPLDDLAATW